MKRVLLIIAVIVTIGIIDSCHSSQKSTSSGNSSSMPKDTSSMMTDTTKH